MSAHPTRTFHLDRRMKMMLFCFYFSAAALIAADLSSVKLTQLHVFGYTLVIPGGTIAFAFTFVCTDVIIELSNRATAMILLIQTLIVRVLILLYFLWVVGPGDGSMYGFETPAFWSADDQKSFSFVLSGTVPIYIAGFTAIFLGFIFDIYIYSYLREKQRGRNTFYRRNILATIAGQAINSVVFVTIAFATTLTLPEIMSAVIGMIAVKIVLAFIDPLLAVMMRNWGEHRARWWAVWDRNFWVDYENYEAPAKSTDEVS